MICVPRPSLATVLMRYVPDKVAIGCLLSLVACTRMDIACALQTCARCGVIRGPLRWEAVLRIMKYLEISTRYSRVWYYLQKTTEFALKNE